MSIRERLVNRLSEHFANVPDALRKRRWLAALAFFGFLALSVYGLSILKMDMTIEGWFQKDDPTLVAFNQYHAQFGSEDGLYIVYKPKDGNVFSPASLEAVRGIQQDLINYRAKLQPNEKSALDHIVKVNTLVNAPVLTVDGDVLMSKPLVGAAVPQSAEELAKIKRVAESEKQFPLQFFSRNHQYGGIYVETDFGAIPVESGAVSGDGAVSMEPIAEGDAPVQFKPTDQADYYNLFEEVKKILNKPEYAKQLGYYAVGNTAAAEHDLKMVEEMGNLYMAALAIIVLLLWFLFRSASAVLWSLLIVILSTVFTLGVAGLLGLTVTGFLILTILLVLTVGIADSVHMLSGYTAQRRHGEEHRKALRTVFRNAGVALLLTGLTNMIGIYALNLTPVVPIKNFAIMSTLGVFFALMLTIYLLPLLVDLWPTVPKVVKSKADGKPRKPFLNVLPLLSSALGKVVPAVEKRPVAYIVPFMLLFVICIYGSTNTKVDTQILDQYPKDSTYTQSVEVADKHMMGANNMVLYLDFHEDFALQDPAVLKEMDALQRTFESKYKKYVVMTTSLADVVKDANRKLNEGKAEYDRIPDTRKLTSQTLFLFNSANPTERQRMVDDNYRKANIKISLHNYGSYEYGIVLKQMREDIDRMTIALKARHAKTQVTITGIFALAQEAADNITRNEVMSFGLAIIAVSAVLLLVFGSLRVGLIALIPNLIPAFMTLGLLGLFGRTLDFYTMMLAPIILGISVDDTVHFITGYQMQLKQDGNVNAALRRTMTEAGPGIVFTSLILGLGFGIMAIASAAGTANMGKFGALAIGMGLLNDLFLLPALLLVFKPKFSEARAPQHDGIAEGSIPVGAVARVQTQVNEAEVVQ